MVLEDVESDNEGQQQCESQTKAHASPAPLNAPTAQAQQEETPKTPFYLVQSQKCCDIDLEAPAESMTKMSLEDAETQTGRWTPFIESIKKEAEGVALATMEERYGRWKTSGRLVTWNNNCEPFVNIY